MTTTARQPRLFVTGTDTNIGKTHVVCLIARQLRSRGVRVAGYKPACSGAIGVTSIAPPTGTASTLRWDDIERIKAAVGDEWPDEVICPQRFIAPLAPPVAARHEGRTVDFPQLVNGADAFEDAEIVLIEGAGGWLSPVTETQTVADLAVAVDVPVLIVARPGLGTINHTLLTIEAIRSRGLVVAGVIMSSTDADQGDESSRINAQEIEARSGVPVLGLVPYQNELELHQHGRPVTIDWMLLARHGS